MLSQKLPVPAGAVNVSRSLLIFDSVLLRSRYSQGGIGFQGWRLSLSKRGTAFTKYYSDKQHGGQRKALKAANTARTELKERRQAWETQRTEAQGKVDKLYFEELEQLKKNFSAAVARVMKTLIGRAF